MDLWGCLKGLLLIGAPFPWPETPAGLDPDTCVRGGGTVAAVNRTRVAERMAHVSTGCGAFLEYMDGRELPGVSVLLNRET
jgi:3-phosphoglycerate kinase